MGRRGVKPMPASVRHLNGITAPSKAAPEYAAPASLPEFPAYYVDDTVNPREFQAVWDRVNVHLHAMKMQSAVDENMLNAYVTAVVQMDRLAKVMLKAPAVIRDPNGQPAPNPLFNAWHKWAQQVRSLGAQFGMSGPTSRVGTRGAPSDQVIGSRSRTDDLAG